MRYLILSDIHSNVEALEKCLTVAEGRYDETLCLGDVVGYGPDPNAAVDAVRNMEPVIIRGNHDKACCGIIGGEDFNPYARMATLWTRDQLSVRNLALLRNLPSGPIDVNGFQLVHGSPQDEDEYLAGPDEAMEVLLSMAPSVAFFGHTHLQGGFQLNADGVFQIIRAYGQREGCIFTLQLEEGARYLINPGSVGQPRDRDWRAAFAIFDSDRRRVEYYRTSYDLPRTQEKMRQAGLPEPLITRLEFGR